METTPQRFRIEQGGARCETGIKNLWLAGQDMCTPGMSPYNVWLWLWLWLCRCVAIWLWLLVTVDTRYELTWRGGCVGYVGAMVGGGFAAGAVLGYTALDALALDRTVFGDLVTTAKQEAAAAAKTK